MHQTLVLFLYVFQFYHQAETYIGVEGERGGQKVTGYFPVPRVDIGQASGAGHGWEPLYTIKMDALEKRYLK